MRGIIEKNLHYMKESEIMDNKLFISRLKDTMEKLELSQSQLSRQANISKSAISDYSNGNRQPRIDAVERIATVLKVSPSWLVGWDNWEK